jgi:hypothetical protein
MASQASLSPHPNPSSMGASRRPSLANSLHSLQRRDSHVVIQEATPLTPPLSPAPDETTGKKEAIVMNEPHHSSIQDQHQFSNAGAAPAQTQTTQQTPDESNMEVDPPTAPEPEAPRPQRPLRLLEDEQVHLTRHGLKLSDFEIRGTLGSSALSY